MRCPRGDGELIERSTTGVSGIPITYHICLGCLGHWIEPFDANYLPISVLPDDTTKPESTMSFRCPECQEPLERAQTQAMSPDVLAWHCTAGHGYFFPRGNLRKFRMAQDARVTYHKLWQIPTPPIQSVLLTSVILFMLVTSGVLLAQMRERQMSSSQAQTIIASRQVIISNGTVAIFVQTSTPTSLSLTIEALGIDSLMQSRDGLIHEILVKDVTPGTYMYTLRAMLDEKERESPVYDFYVPATP